MKRWKTLLLLFVLTFSIPTVFEASSTLQSKIDRAPEGSTIVIEQGEYEETVKISKPIILVGQGEVVLRSCEAPVITLSGKDITLKNMKVEHCGTEKEDTAVIVTGSNHHLKGLSIETSRYAIRLDQANHVTIRDSEIVGTKQGNGIDLWKSNRNQLENLKISDVSDGIYLEQSHENTIHRNHIENSRYGMHLMFSNDNVLSENTSRSNITGTMLMEAKRTSVRNNAFTSNSHSVNAQGLLLYAASETKVMENEFISNRVGMYIEQAENNHLEANQIMDNFIGVQFQGATGNQMVNNTFVGNVNDAQAIESSSNEVSGNYWDASSKVDVDGNGKSDIVFTADPYFLTLTTDVPEFQLFFQAPGLILLQKMLKSPPEQLLTDPNPLMDMTMGIEKETSSNVGLWMMSVVMMFASLTLLIIGRKRS